MSKLANTNLNINPSSNPISQTTDVAIIYKNLKPSSQSGVKNVGSYSIIFVNKLSINSKNINNFMSWVCNANSLNSLNLMFNNLESAVEYCKQKNCEFLVLQDQKSSNKIIKPKSYTANFI